MNETININPNRPLLTVQNLNLTRGTFQLKDISFSVNSDEILAIIGNNLWKTILYKNENLDIYIRNTVSSHI